MLAAPRHHGRRLRAERASVRQDRGRPAALAREAPSQGVRHDQRQAARAPGRLLRPADTKIGRDVDFDELVQRVGLLARCSSRTARGTTGRCRSTAPSSTSARASSTRTRFIYWFNHFTERGYEGPQLRGRRRRHRRRRRARLDRRHEGPPDRGRAAGARRARHRRGHAEQLETEGIPDVLASTAHLEQARAAGRDALLPPPHRGHAARRHARGRRPGEASRSSRRRAAASSRRPCRSTCFTVLPLRMPVGLLVERRRLVGLQLPAHARREGQGRADRGQVRGRARAARVSSIGSVPEPMLGIGMRGQLYAWSDDRARPVSPAIHTVFSVGNVVTGKGNIIASRRHSVRVSAHVIEQLPGPRERQARAARRPCCARPTWPPPTTRRVDRRAPCRSGPPLASDAGRRLARARRARRQPSATRLVPRLARARHAARPRLTRWAPWMASSAS